jgi:hypothetical protein
VGVTVAGALTDEQRAEVEELVAEAVHAAVVPVARQVTEWLTVERRRLEQPRRTWTGRRI